MTDLAGGRIDTLPERRFGLRRFAGPEMLILVSEDNRASGSGEKLDVHRRGQLHRAFSIFLFDAKGRVLLQQRDRGKYHSGGLWANTCCGHPLVGERTRAAANRRLLEELGMTARLTFGFQARYRAALDNNLIENELVYAYGGQAEDAPRPNPTEVMATRFLTLDELDADAAANPAAYAYWLRHYLLAHGDALRRMAGHARG
jgi:isopentenyl-diphosphate delta-isomerase